MYSVYNAKIKFSYLGFKDENSLCLYWQLGFTTEAGDYMTDKMYIKDTSCISRILQVLSLRQWEDIPRKFARIRVDDNGNVISIGNLISNEWVELV